MVVREEGEDVDEAELASFFNEHFYDGEVSKQLNA